MLTRIIKLIKNTWFVGRYNIYTKIKDKRFFKKIYKVCHSKDNIVIYIL